MNRISLPGCRTEPLAGYLKALATLRLVAQQKDADAKGRWEDDCFNIQSSLDRDGLIAFFLREYSPTPVLAPWNGGSGFYDKDSKDGIESVLKSIDRRFADYREAIDAVSSWPEMVTARECRATKKELDDEIKQALILACRSRLSERALEWIDAAVAAGVEAVSYPPLLGTGGNEGRLEYTNAFMRLVTTVLGMDAAKSAELLQNALFGTPASGLTIEPVGQHDPGRAGGFNQGPGIEQKKFPTNPWNFVFAIEGAIVWSSSVPRRHGVNTTGLLVSPFTVRPRAVGYTSSTELSGRKGAPRYGLQSGIGRQITARCAPFSARDARMLATAPPPMPSGSPKLRVLSALIEESQALSAMCCSSVGGDSYVALPAGRFPVCHRAESDLIREELEPALNRFDSFQRRLGNQAPASLTSARRQIDECIYELLLHGGPPRVRTLIESIGKLEWLLSRRDPKRTMPDQPLDGLSARWIAAADDGSVEVRLAAALRSIRPAGAVGPIRANLTPVAPDRPWLWAEGAAQTAWIGNSLASRMASVVARRLTDSERLSVEGSPFEAGLTLWPDDIAAFLDGDVDDALLEDLIFGFLWVDWRHPASREALTELRSRWSVALSDRPASRSWALLKLLFTSSALHSPVGERLKVRPESSIVPLLCAGRVGEACRIAQRRLLISGLNPLRVHFADSSDGTRIAAALLFPVRTAPLMRWSSAQTGGENVRAT